MSNSAISTQWSYKDINYCRFKETEKRVVTCAVNQRHYFIMDGSINDLSLSF